MKGDYIGAMLQSAGPAVKELADGEGLFSSCGLSGEVRGDY